MNYLILGIGIAVSLSIVPLIAQGFIVYRRKTQNSMEWLKHHGMPVKAPVAQVQTGQDWKYEQGWDRDPWNGSLKQKRTWQTYHEVTAHWLDLRTKQEYTFCGKVWSDEVTGKPMKGHPVRVIVDPHHPSRYRMDVQSLSEPISYSEMIRTGCTNVSVAPASMLVEAGAFFICHFPYGNKMMP